jgi:UDP-3-O-[3-hydroxymyristoyl] glucosamine N-acyltransferase
MPESLKSYPLKYLASKVGATLVGDGEIEIVGLCPLDEPAPKHLAFSRAVSVKHLAEELKTAKIAAVMTSAHLNVQSDRIHIPVLMVPDPLGAIVDLIPLFYEGVQPAPAISPKADIDPSAELGPGVSVGAFCSIGANVKIGAGARLYPQVVLYPGAVVGERSVLHSGVIIREHCIVGNDCILHNGCVIGADGFGYIPDAQMGLKKVPQVGIVKIEERVEIGANTCVDRAALGITLIGAGTKIDNLVQIGHNVKTGQCVIICGQVGIAGSCRLDSGVVIGGRVGIADHLHIASGVRVGGHAGVTSNLETKDDYSGFPAVPAHQWRRQSIMLARLAEAWPKLRKLLKE